MEVRCDSAVLETSLRRVKNHRVLQVLVAWLTERLWSVHRRHA